jgi:hypothetical protein
MLLKVVGKMLQTALTNTSTMVVITPLFFAEPTFTAEVIHLNF